MQSEDRVIQSNPSRRASARLMAALRSRRRGTFLVLVVGTLAMLSIIMIVYVAVGNADQRTSVGAVRRNRSDEVVDGFAEYIAQVIADDVTATVPDAANDNFTSVDKLYFRETWDAPRTDWNKDSKFAATDFANARNFFTPYGRGDDPWLASTTPTWINYVPQTNAPQNTDKTFAKRMDWLHISNLAPDGRFINLANLRESFGSEPGIGNGPSGGARMSTGLTLYNATTGQPDRRTVWGENTNTSNASSIPAFFDSWQAQAFRPAQPPFKNGASDISPLDAEYPPNQWADADGDGFFDSRWFEMVDARGANFNAPTTWRNLLPADSSYRWVFAARVVDLSALVNVNVAGDLNANPNDETTLLTDKGEAIDASLKWKYGTQVLGRSPAEIDLRRLLTMRDFREVILGQPATNGLPAAIAPTASLTIDDIQADKVTQTVNRTYAGGFSGLRQPPPPSGAGPKSVEDYSVYSSLIADINQTQGISPSATLPNDVNIGLGAYRAMRAAAAVGRAPGRFNDFTAHPLKLASQTVGSQELRWQAFNTTAGAVDRPIYRANAQGTYLTEPGFDFGLGFRTETLLELLTYRGTNDPDVTSSLEAAMGGRASSELGQAPTINTAPILLSPLRENRSLEIERANLSYSTGSNAGKPTEAAMLKAYTDVRQYLTTLSGARPITGRLQTSLGTDPWLTGQSELGTDDISIALTKDTPASSIFGGFANALMPGLPAGIPVAQPPATATVLDKAWDESAAEAKILRGMFYGHQGPMTALLTAAHMAANFDSGAKLATDTTRSNPYALVLSEDFQADVDGKLPTNTTPTSGFLSAKRYFPGWWQGRQFNLARAETARTNPTTVARIPKTTAEANLPVPAVNVYGTGDPHPFLVGVATYTVYRDTYGTASLEGRQYSDIEGFGTPPHSGVKFITINGVLDDKNPDFLFRVFAVQMHNPHPYPLKLSSNVSTSGNQNVSGPHVDINTLDQSHYIRVGTGNRSKYYVLLDVDEKIASDQYSGEYSVQPVVMQPGETIVFYALSRDRKSIAEKKVNASARFDSATVNSPQLLEKWLENQLGPKSGTNFRRLQMLRVEDSKFGAAAAPQLATPVFTTTNRADGVLVPPAEDSDDHVMLFRSLRIDSGGAVNDSVASSPNWVGNDQMCDRIRVGQDSPLDRRLISADLSFGFKAQTRLPGVTTQQDRDRDSVLHLSGPRPFVNDNPIDYNSRLTLALATYVRRPADPSGVAIGQLPAWAIDPKESDSANPWYRVKLYPDKPDRGEIQMDSTLLGAAMNAPYRNEFARFNLTDWDTWDAMFPDLTRAVGAAGTGDIGTSPPNNLAGNKFSDLRRELASNGNGYRSYAVDSSGDAFQARPVDLLGVLGVGPYETPLDAAGAEITDLKKRWTTTAEALAIAFGYSKKPADRDTWKAAGNNYGPLDYYYFDRYSTAANPDPLYDGGYLKLHDYACSRIDMTDPAKPKYYPAGNGAPIAGNILTTFRTAPDRLAGLTVSTPGLVNINTAPSAVLRVLPLAFPAEDVTSTSTKSVGNQPKPTFWPAVNGTAAEIAAQRTDIAAMIESYRDKIAVPLRPGAMNPAASSFTTTPHYSWFAPFIDRDQPTVIGVAAANRKPPSDPSIGVPDNLPAQYTGGRYWTTGITGIREEAGFRSLAELLALRSVKVDTATLGGQADGRDQPINIDFLGHIDPASNATGTNLLGIDSVLQLTADTSGVATDAKPLQFAGTNQDRLKILAALGGSVTARSDLYAAWFIARGYQRSDVEGLAADQPMLPSIERRFLMIIDRSNVTRPGQKPRIVAMVELPL
ncbi:MAG TPA: hypothetical protein VF777_00075 [Phycisphaerales bacterium]